MAAIDETALAQLAMLGELAAELQQASTVEALASELAGRVKWVLDCDRCDLLVEANGSYRLYPDGAPVLTRDALPTPWRMALDHQMTIRTGDASRESWRFTPGSPHAELASHLVLPLQGADTPVGALILAAHRSGAYSTSLPIISALLQRITAGVLQRLRSLEAERAARKQAEEATRLRDEVLAVVSHDLRSPLSSIDLAAGLLRAALASGEQNPGAALGRLDVISRATRRMVGLISSLLDTARLQSGSALALQRGPVDLAALASEVVKEQQGLAASVPIRLSRAPESLMIDADADRIERVLANLIGNAIKYSPSGGRVDVRVDALDGWGRVQIADQGIGIPAADLPKVFSPFFRAGNVQMLPGSGLGLHAVRRIVELHGGRIQIKSTEGEGTTIEVLLPCA